MNKMRKIEPVLIIDGWNVYQETYGFYCANNGKTLVFEAEYRNGTYFKIKSYYDGKRSYFAERYFYKLIPLVQNITFELLKNGCLWDNKNDRPALETYKKGMEAYYKKCKELGLETGDFLDNLYL
jgi:hypothetical protein